MIVVRGLTRRYGRRTAIDGLDFEVPAGSVVGFLGPNGAGKTTTMRILTGALSATEGSAHIGGHDVFEAPRAVKRLVGYLPEQPPLHPDLPVRRMLAFGAGLHGVARPRHAAEAVLERVGLAEVADRRVGHLSKGYRQRVGLGLALVHQPRVLILDEPASGLDPAQRVEIRALVRQLASDDDVTVILSTHVLAEVEAVCDAAILIARGRIQAQGTLEALGRRDGRVRVQVQRPEGLADALGRLDGVARVVAEAPDRLRVEGTGELRPAVATVAAAHGLLSLSAADGLEEAFLRLTGEA